MPDHSRHYAIYWSLHILTNVFSQTDGHSVKRPTGNHHYKRIIYTVVLDLRYVGE